MRYIILSIIVTGFCLVQAYPIDAYPQTGIKRLEQQRLIQEKKLAGTPQPQGATRPDSAMKLHLQNMEDSTLFKKDPVLQKQVENIFKGLDKNYSLSIMVLKPDHPPKYAAYRDQVNYQPGSVGKMAVLTGVMDELARRFPNDTIARKSFLKNTNITASSWIHVDSKTVPFWDVEKKKGERRKLKVGDKLNLYEWLDHMISPSNNASASTVWKELILMHEFGTDYPASADREKAFWNETPRKDLKDKTYPLVNDPLYAAGIDSTDFQLGSLFTSNAKKQVSSIGTRANTRALLKFLVRMEQGQIVDPWSSLEMKKFMYSTWRRIRYATAGSLRSSAVYFKSGSLYKCKTEEGYSCQKYKGNVENYMNSIAIVEAPDGTVYWVALMSNVLKKDSASDHRTLADRIHQMVMKLK